MFIEKSLRKKKTLFKSTLIARENVNRNKLIVQQFQQFSISNDNNRIHSFNHVLRVLIDFSYFINYVYDDDEMKIENCFTFKNIKTKKNVFFNHFKKNLNSFSKYEHLLNIIDNKIEKNYQF